MFTTEEISYFRNVCKRRTLYFQFSRYILGKTARSRTTHENSLSALENVNPAQEEEVVASNYDSLQRNTRTGSANQPLYIKSEKITIIAHGRV